LKKLVKIVLAIVIIIAIPKLIQQVFFGKPSFQKELAKAASEINAGLPRKVDATTTLTSVTTGKGVWRVNYEMDKGSPIDRTKDDTYKAFALRQICGSDMKLYLEQKVTIEYHYTYEDASGKQELLIAIPPGSCG